MTNRIEPQTRKKTGSDESVRQMNEDIDVVFISAHGCFGFQKCSTDRFYVGNDVVNHHVRTRKMNA